MNNKDKDKDEIGLLSEMIDSLRRETKIKVSSLQTSIKLLDARVGQIEENVKNFNEQINILSGNDQSLSWNISQGINDVRVDLYKVKNELSNALSPGLGPKKIVRVNSRARV